MPKKLPTRRLDESESALQSILERPTCRVCRPVKISGDDLMISKLKELAPLWDGLVLSRGPEPKEFEGILLASVPNTPALAHWAAGELNIRKFCGRPDFHLPPVLFYGPPGTGKTTAARLLAQAAGTPFHVFNVAASSDARTLLGTSAGYSTGSAGLAAKIMARTRRANPVLVVDEIDKACGDDRGGSWKDGLLPYLESSTAGSIFDEFLMNDIDCRHITWIATANDLDRIPAPLLDRFHLIEFKLRPPIDIKAFDLQVLQGLAEETGLELEVAKALLDEINVGENIGQLSMRRQKRLARFALAKILGTRSLQ